jgi:HemY protein
VLADREVRWSAAAIHQAADANALADRWESLPKPLRAEPTIVAAYSDRAAALGWDETATSSIEQALGTRWDERLAARYGSLPLTRYAERQAVAERWLQQHPGSPALLLTLARLARHQDQPQAAMDYAQRALAQGAGSEGWEELGHGYVQLGDDARAREAYGNALRALRGEPLLPGGFSDPGPRNSIDTPPR